MKTYKDWKCPECKRIRVSANNIITCLCVCGEYMNEVEEKKKPVEIHRCESCKTEIDVEDVVSYNWCKNCNKSQGVKEE
jgi:hypothetical protein